MKTKGNLTDKAKQVIQKGKPALGGAGKVKQVTTKRDSSDYIEDPFAGLEPTGDLEADAREEERLMIQALREADRRIQEDRELVNDTEYFVCIIFESRDQKEAWLKAKGWILMGDKYLDGVHIARLEGIPLPPVTFPAENRTVKSTFVPLVDPDFD